MHIEIITAGVVLLLIGRKLFWLFLGIAGFLFGMETAPMVFSDQQQWMHVAIALGIGFIGAMLALAIQRFAFAAGGFFGGMYLALMAGPAFGVESADTMLIITLAAGIIGAIIAILVMDTAITLLACLVGAAAVVSELHLGPSLDLLVFVILAGSGFYFQQHLLGRGKGKRKMKDEE